MVLCEWARGLPGLPGLQEARAAVSLTGVAGVKREDGARTLKALWRCVRR